MRFYITTTLPYVNADPHIGFAMEIIRADVLARYHRLIGDEVVFNTGTDEHGQKIYLKALEEKKSPQTYCNQHAQKFFKLKKYLNLSFTNFIRTTNLHHIKAAQEFWQLCQKNGDIYKAKYQIKYCVGCELEKTDSELINNQCPIHPNRKLEIINEENYFFRFQKYQKKLLDFYEKNPHFVIPQYRFNEIKEFVKKGLKDFSISRLKKKMPWGIDVPNDPQQVMYVWFDALINYISTLGWPTNLKNFRAFWPGVQIAGKDNLRQQAAMWQAMLFSAKLPPSKQIYIEGFITVEGAKISKSLGNTIDPINLVKKYSTDALRYYLLREIPAYDDGDFSENRFKNLYNADLANNLGNLTARIAKIAEKEKFSYQPSLNFQKAASQNPSYQKAVNVYNLNQALSTVFDKVNKLNLYLDRQKPWQTKGKKLQRILKESCQAIYEIALLLQPFLPDTAEKILKQFTNRIKFQKPLFPRLK